MTGHTLDLTGSWEFKEYPLSARRMRDLDPSDWLPASVPSSIYGCLERAGLAPADQIPTRSKESDPAADKPWIFRKIFEVPDSIADLDRKILCFEGLDTVTQIWLNEKCIVRTDNMFSTYRMDVTDTLRRGTNCLMVKILPPLETARQRMNRYGELNVLWGDPSRVYLRKAQYQFGTELHPARLGGGIFRPVRLEAFSKARLQDLHVRTLNCSQHYADIQVSVTVERFGDSSSRSELTGELAISGGAANQETALHFSKEDDRLSAILRMERPFLWWPNGFGVQFLYQLNVRLKQDSETLDQKEISFGIRTLQRHHAESSSKNTFSLEVNGQPISIHGAVWMPASLQPGEKDFLKIEAMLKKFSQANGNLLRVWAGGVIEEPAFYHLCDRLGILVWQEFPFADAYYPDRNWFSDSVRTEAADIIRNLRNHPCLAVWCGNSGIDQLHQQKQLGSGRKYYGKSIYHRVLPELVSRLDPDREYLPSANLKEPQTGPNPDDTPTIAQYGCLSWACSGYTASPRAAAACHVPMTPMKQALLPQLSRQCADLFGPPQSPQEWIDQVQLMQARHAKENAERLRAEGSPCSAQIMNAWNDSSAGAGFGAFDWKGRPNAVYYYARRFWSPVLVTLQKKDHASPRKDLAVVLNENSNPLTGFLSVELMDFHGRILDQVRHPVSMAPYAKPFQVILPRELSNPANPDRTFLKMTVENENGILVENCFLFLQDQFVLLPAVDLECSIQKTQSEIMMTLSSSVFIKDLMIQPPAYGQTSENWLDLIPGRTAQIRIAYTEQPPPCWIPCKFLSIPAKSRHLGLEYSR